jgi:pimeloyl-ACP methyl ester carboxylesterase
MAYLGIDGFDLYYEVHGEGPPVVFAHGVAGNHASWYRQIPAFSARYKVVLFDHRGFGNSRDVANSPGQSRFIDDLKALFDHLEISKAALVGQSMGGGTSAGFTKRYPERVAALAMCDSLAGFKLPAATQELMAAVARSADGMSQLERVLGQTFRSREPALSYLYTALAGFNSVNRKTLRGTLGESLGPEELTASGVPVLFLVGAEDVLFPPQVVREVHELVKGSRFVELPEAGHSAYFECPQSFNDAVLDFLSAVGVG